MSEQYNSQYGQDKFFDEEIFRKKEHGFFLDIGAHDGVSLSNTYFFEKFRNWRGICVEPLPHIFERLRINRNCIKIQGCIANFNGSSKFIFVDGGEGEFPEMLSGLSDFYDPKHYQLVQHGVNQHNGSLKELQVQCYQINDILTRYKVSHIDYCSIDTEGSELQILKSIDFKSHVIEAFSVENNFGERKIRLFMKSKNYELIKHLKGDDFYVLRKKKYFWKFW